MKGVLNMPLYYLPDTLVKKVPHERENRAIIDRIPAADLEAIKAELNRRIDAVVDTDEELITSGWIPGHEWAGTVWLPIYETAHKDAARAGMVFGAIVFEVMMEREEDWSLGKYQVDGRDIGSITYFRIHR